MGLKERIFHAIFFELGALLIAVITIKFISHDTETASALGLSVLMAITAMGLNFLFNLLFDKIFTGKRENRGIFLRLFHTFCFEATLLIFTIPMVAYALDLNWLQAFLADVGLTLIIMLYAFLFNWAYDHLRLKFVINN